MPPKPIPKSLKKSILTTLVNNKSMGALTPTQICERVNDDPNVPQNQKKKPKQMAHLMKNLARSIEGVETIVLSSNGTSRHGNQRFRVGYEAPEMTLAEAEEAAGVMQKPKKNLKQITVNLPDECVDVIKAWRAKGVSAGRYVEQLIRADVEANGVPESDD